MLGLGNSRLVLRRKTFFFFFLDFRIRKKVLCMRGGLTDLGCSDALHSQAGLVCILALCLLLGVEFLDLGFQTMLFSLSRWFMEKEKKKRRFMVGSCSLSGDLEFQWLNSVIGIMYIESGGSPSREHSVHAVTSCWRD